jgi:hypothetical protein
MKLAVAAIIFMASATLFADSYRFKKAVESYSTNEKLLKAEKEMKGREFRLPSALAAHRFLNEHYSKEKRKIVIVDVHLREEHHPWIEHFPEGEHIWMAVEEGWIGEGKLGLIYIRASNAEFILDGRQHEK